MFRSTPLHLMTATLALVCLRAQAAPVSPVSYDTPNGYGVATGGSANYWDLNYTGTGATSTDGAPLSGGLGDLTDGVIAPDNWFVTENGAGSGPYVGWREIDPSIAFSFAVPLQFTSVRVYLDDSDGQGGVSFPSRISVNGITTDLLDPPGPAPSSVEIPLAGLTTDVLTIQLFRSNTWVFASEFSFEAVEIPEPAAGGVLGIGLAVAAVLRRFAR